LIACTATACGGTDNGSRSSHDAISADVAQDASENTDEYDSGSEDFGLRPDLLDRPSTYGNECVADEDCADESGCTDNSCTRGYCSTMAHHERCEDNDACTLNRCLAEWTSAGGCSFSSKIGCNDGSACTVDSCDPELGCQHVPNNALCDDNDPCTNDFCEGGDMGQWRCQHTVLNCVDKDLQTVDICVAGIGCVNEHVDCGQELFSDCPDGGPCTDVHCVGGECVSNPRDCDDGSPCTNDFCDTNGQCVHQNACPQDGNFCTVNNCLRGLCTAFGNACEDGKIWTRDFCDPVGGRCVNDLIPGMCADLDDCADGNTCTEDSCQEHVCVYIPVVCDDGMACTSDLCIPGGDCRFSSVCNDSDPCTLDACTVAGCTYTPACQEGKICSVVPTAERGFQCRLPGCGSNEECDDSDLCTLDECLFDGEEQVCSHNLVDCEDGNQCTFEHCDPQQGCTSALRDCSDHDACTVDTCSIGDGECNHASIECNDGNACTEDLCDISEGCSVSPELRDCDDGDPCSLDSCDPFQGCMYQGNPACPSNPCEEERYVGDCTLCPSGISDCNAIPSATAECKAFYNSLTRESENYCIYRDRDETIVGGVGIQCLALRGSIVSHQIQTGIGAAKASPGALFTYRHGRGWIATRFLTEELSVIDPPEGCACIDELGHLHQPAHLTEDTQYGGMLLKGPALLCIGASPLAPPL
jgi:hypothetical protein